MRILEYVGLDTRGVTAEYRKAAEAIARDDFRAAEVKKLANLGHGKFYRARLDGANRLLFALIRHGDETCALMLEMFLNHDYAKSRFLRGASIDETKIPDFDAAVAHAEAQPVRYLHAARTSMHFLDKPISFDDAQYQVYRLPPPLIVVGSAGSGKTALTLEKLKEIEGEALYVTRSTYLAQNARDLYYANGFEREGQEVAFLSYREFVESVRVPEGREAGWREFSGWFARMRQGHAFKGIDAHQAFEEIRGVVAARAGGVLAREDYRALGVRQSIFPAEQRDRLYDLFEKYRDWLAEAKLYDVNLLAHEWLVLAAARYDFVVVDEVQDLTTAQLALVLKTLKRPDRFMLCGDSNQIVHPNFFSWSQVKTLFWRDPEIAERQALRVLAVNFRNGVEVTRLANMLLKVKHRRFGSIDRESNFLVETVGGEAGKAVLLPDRDAAKRELDRTIRRSTEFAVLVLREEDKAAAREYFSTPLLFAVHEAKGLEYENVVLYGFVSGHRREYAEIAAGVARQDVLDDTLDYRRARDKSDKSLEIYKFYVNALYVALTRAVKNAYLVESDTAHPLFELLELAVTGNEAKVEARESSVDEWQKEARKLELQGKRFTRLYRSLDCAFDTKLIVTAWEGLPEKVVRAARNRRQHISNVLSRNELDRDYAYNRSLFKRVSHGWYQLNPALEVRCRSASGEELWRPVFAALNLPLIAEVADAYALDAVNRYLTMAGMPACPVPIMAEQEAARREEEALREREERPRRDREAPPRREARRAPAESGGGSQRRSAPDPRAPGEKAPWGTPEARWEAMMELQRRIERRDTEDKEEE